MPAREVLWEQDAWNDLAKSLELNRRHTPLTTPYNPLQPLTTPYNPLLLLRPLTRASSSTGAPMPCMSAPPCTWHTVHVCTVHVQHVHVHVHVHTARARRGQAQPLRSCAGASSLG